MTGFSLKGLVLMTFDVRFYVTTCPVGLLCIGARRVAELASKRFLRERIRLTQKAKGDAKRETESTAEGITATLMANEASEILEKIKVNTQRVFNATKDRQ